MIGLKNSLTLCNRVNCAKHDSNRNVCLSSKQVIVLLSGMACNVYLRSKQVIVLLSGMAVITFFNQTLVRRLSSASSLFQFNLLARDL